MQKRYKHQTKFLKKNPAKFLLVWGCGTGKTRSAIEWGDSKRSVLIVVPKSLTTNWERELTLWSRSSITKYQIITKENFRKYARSIPKFEAVIMDECHFFAGMKPVSLMSKNMLGYLKKYKVQYVLGLTATPYLSKAWNIYRLAKLLGKEWSYPEFKREFYVDIRMGNRIIEKPRANTQDLLAQKVGEIGRLRNLRTASTCQ